MECKHKDTSQPILERYLQMSEELDSDDYNKLRSLCVHSECDF